jgi:hypothetical protein
MSHLDSETKADAQQLFTTIVEFAKEMLNQNGELLPFAYAMSTDGKLEAFGAIDDLEEPSVQKIYALLRAGLSSAATAGRIRAAGICFAVTITGKFGETHNAIRILTEHRNGLAADTLMPFRIEKQIGLCFGKARTKTASNSIFIIGKSET